MSWSCPFHSFQLPLHVPVIFSVCPLPFPCMSRSFVASQFPTSPVVPIGFLVLCFPFIFSALFLFSFLSLSCPFQFLFVSLSFPLAFLSGRLPISSPHFLAFPCISPLLPSISRKKKALFFQRFRKEDVKPHRVFQIFGKRRQEIQTRKEPAGGFEPGVLWNVIKLPRGTWGNPPLNPTYQTSGGGLGGWVILYPLIGIRHASAMSARPIHVRPAQEGERKQLKHQRPMFAERDPEQYPNVALRRPVPVELETVFAHNGF